MSGNQETGRLAVGKIEPGVRVKTILLVLEKRAQVTRKGDSYLALVLGDRTGSISARVWDNAEHYGTLFDSGDYLYVEGAAETYHDRVQLRLSHVERVAAKAVDARDFQPTSRFQPEQMLGELRDLIAKEVRNATVRRILRAILGDDEVVSGLRSAPAAKGNHHAYLAGLLEHSLSMCRLAASIGAHYDAYYPGLLDRDLLIAGAVLHDIGKIWELSIDRTIDYTDEGRLVGHIVIGVELLNRTFERLGISDADLMMRLKHMVLSHHGEPEFGAVVVPQTPEALVLHYIDQIDSRLNMAAAAIEGTDGRWTSYVRPLGRFVFAGGEIGEKGARRGVKSEEEGQADAEATTETLTLDLFRE